MPRITEQEEDGLQVLQVLMIDDRKAGRQGCRRLPLSLCPVYPCVRVCRVTSGDATPDSDEEDPRLACNALRTSGDLACALYRNLMEEDDEEDSLLCPNPCETLTLESNEHTAPLHIITVFEPIFSRPDWRLRYSAGVFQLRIPSNPDITVRKTVPMSTFSGLLGTIGGHLGLWTGMSVMTVIEYIEYFIAAFTVVIIGGRGRCVGPKVGRNAARRTMRLQEELKEANQIELLGLGRADERAIHEDLIAEAELPNSGKADANEGPPLDNQTSVPIHATNVTITSRFTHS
eukprot:GHVU01097734.1.p1 GENE.GHVU01097734.1~~GHVU01097734.1.p1  ORF type:complete len:289 (-),score=30.37 GHVU01097734.1:86-952(-)